MPSKTRCLQNIDPTWYLIFVNISIAIFRGNIPSDILNYCMQGQGGLCYFVINRTDNEDFGMEAAIARMLKTEAEEITGSYFFVKFLVDRLPAFAVCWILSAHVDCR